MNNENTIFKFKDLGIDTYKEAILYLREDCHLCRAEGLRAKSFMLIEFKNKSIIATINTVRADFLNIGEISLSVYAQNLLGIKDGDKINVTRAKPVNSLSYLRSKIYNNQLSEAQIEDIISDIVHGYYSDIQISSFLTACAGNRFSKEEVLSLTKAMIKISEKITWDQELVVDKHSIGGIPGNRTSPIVVAIVSAFGLLMPKTSSRAITSPAGTADTMEVLTNVDLNIESIKAVAEKENGCFVWGGYISLSPADDILIRIERVLNIDSEGQMVASILSKKIVAGSNHIVIEIPVGKTAKVRDLKSAKILRKQLEEIGKKLKVKIKVLITDGNQPIGKGIGPALEARDVIAVLQNNPEASADLKEKALMLAGEVLEFSPKVKKGSGIRLAREILESGKAWEKFKSICEAQGGLKNIPQADFIHQYLSPKDGVIEEIDNRKIATLAKLAGAPNDKAAGVDLLIKTKNIVKKDQPLFAIHSNSKETIEYALSFFADNEGIIKIK